MLFLGFVILLCQIKMDPGKDSAVDNWPVHSDRKQLQWFLSFDILSCKFIRNYSQTAAPLHALTYSTLQVLLDLRCRDSISVPPHQVFLYSCECSTQQFNIEVEVLEVGVRAVLCPRGTLKTRFTHMLSFYERELRYGEPGVVSSEISIGREETLAGGTEQPMFFWTDHKNLERICWAKWLNSR